MKKLAVILSIGCMIMFSGCETADGEDIKTSGFYAVMTVDYTSQTTLDVIVEYKTGAFSNTYIELENSASISATVGSETKDLRERNSIIDETWYEKSFSIPARGSEVKVSLTRPDDTDALNSYGTIFSPMVVTEPSLDTYSSDIPFSWSRDTATTDVAYLEIDCRSNDINSSDIWEYISLSSSERSAGSGTVLRSDIDSILSPLDLSLYSCTAKAVIERTRSGSVDSAYDDGSFKIQHLFDKTLGI